MWWLLSGEIVDLNDFGTPTTMPTDSVGVVVVVVVVVALRVLMVVEEDGEEGERVMTDHWPTK